MLSVAQIKSDPAGIVKKLAKKHFEAEQWVEDVLKIDEERRATQAQLDQLLAESNQLAKSIGQWFKEGKTDEANAAKEKTKTLKAESKQLQEQLNALEQKQFDTLVLAPNLPHESVPEGKTPDENIEVKQWGSRPSLHQDALPHWELCKDLNLIDFELGTKITGAGFPVYTGKGARLQRALINFFLDQNTSAGYHEVIPPHMVNEDSAFGTGQLPDKEGQMYHVTEDQLYLIPTAEVPVTNIFRNSIVKAEDFPIKYTAYTPCFRREAGSYGKDVRGLNRLHQFDKVEIVQVCHPENSYQALDQMVSHVETLLQALGLEYRILRLCGGDMGFTSALTYDFEVYSAAQERWLEVSSVSNFESYQANRLKLRFKNENGKTELAHTLNGSALALPRILAALLENYQTEEGIKIPEILVPYTGFDFIKK